MDMAALTAEQFEALSRLKVSERQEVLGGSFQESIEAWETAARDQALGLCFLREDRPIGLTLFKRPPLSPPWVSATAASIHGLKIATPWQGQGWGHTAFQAAVGRMCKAWPDVTHLMLAVDAENAAALSVYRAFGMADLGSIFEGPNGLEHRLEISLG